MKAMQSQTKAPYARVGGKDLWALELVMTQGEDESVLFEALTDTDLGDWMFVTWMHHAPSPIEMSMTQHGGQQPKPRLAGGMIAVADPDAWLERYDGINTSKEDAGGSEARKTRTLSNTNASQAKDNVKDIQFYGDSHLFKCLSKAWSKKEGWMKSTKAMNVPYGVVIQVTTQQNDNAAEALTFVPGCQVVAEGDSYTIVPSS